MIGWALWFFLALPLFLVDGWLVQMACPVPCLTFALCLFLGLFARPSALPGLLLCAALARSLLIGGDTAVHVLILGIPVAILVPLRSVFYPQNPLWQCAAAAFLALAVPKLTGLLGRVAETVPTASTVGWTQLLAAVVLVPIAALGLRRLPPLSLFREVAE